MSVAEICEAPAQSRKSVSCRIISGGDAVYHWNVMWLFTTKTGLENARHFIDIVQNVACLAPIYDTSLATSTQHKHTHFR